MNTEKNLIQSFGGTQGLPSYSRIEAIYLIAKKRNLMFEITLLLELIAAFCFGEVKPQLLKTNRPRNLVEEGISR
jgi:hypothetical protein